MKDLYGDPNIITQANERKLSICLQWNQSVQKLKSVRFILAQVSVCCRKNWCCPCARILRTFEAFSVEITILPSRKRCWYVYELKKKKQALKKFTILLTLLSKKPKRQHISHIQILYVFYAHLTNAFKTSRSQRHMKTLQWRLTQDIYMITVLHRWNQFSNIAQSLGICWALHDYPTLKDRYVFLKTNRLCFARLKSGYVKLWQRMPWFHCMKYQWIPTVLHVYLVKNLVYRAILKEHPA